MGGVENRYLLIKSKLDLFILLQDLGLDKLDDRGDEIWALCPYHDDRNPSWSINSNLDDDNWGLHSCWVCKDGRGKGNVVTLARDLLNLESYKEALNWLDNYVGVGNLQEELLDLSLNRRLRELNPTESTQRGKREDAARLYSSFKVLKPDSKGWKYLIGRGVTPQQITQRGARLGRGRYKDRVIFPIIHGNKVVSFYARHFMGGKPKNLHPKGKGTVGQTLYGYDRSNPLYDTCYLMEGLLDVLITENALIKIGFNSDNIFATGGATLLEKQAELLRYWGIVVVIPDMKGNARGIVPSTKELLLEQELFIVEVPKGKDPASTDFDMYCKLLSKQVKLRQKRVVKKIDYSF
jgi:DNA primase